MAPLKIPLTRPDKLDKPLQYGQAEEPITPPIENSDFDSEAETDTSLSEFNDSLNEYIALMPLNDDQSSGEDLETSSVTEPILAEFQQSSDSDEADDIENIWSPILLQISPMTAEESEDLETTEPILGLAELPQTSDSDEADGPADDRVNIWSPILFQIPPMSDEESDGPSDDASMESDGASEGYMGDIESGIEIDDYTVNPREDIWQEDLMIISAEQHIANGLFRLTQFRIPSPMPAICPICQINK